MHFGFVHSVKILKMYWRARGSSYRPSHYYLPDLISLWQTSPSHNQISNSVYHSKEKIQGNSFITLNEKRLGETCFTSIQNPFILKVTFLTFLPIQLQLYLIIRIHFLNFHVTILLICMVITKISKHLQDTAYFLVIRS